MSLLRTALLFILGISLSLSAWTADDFAVELEKTRAIYLKATDGKKRAVRKAIKSTRRLSHRYPQHPLATIYHGAALSLRGIAVDKRPLDRMRETEQGLNILDRALRRLAHFQGDELEIIEGQLVASFLFINLPDSYFHRLKEGTHLVQGLLDHPRFKDIPRAMQSAIYLAAANAAEKNKRQDDYRRYLQQAIDAAPSSSSARDARRLLDGIDD